MKTRIISACIMLPLIALVYFGGYLLMAACIVVSFIGVHEFYKGYEAVGSRPAYGLAYAAIVLLYAAEILAPGNSVFDFALGCACGYGVDDIRIQG